VLLNCSRIYKEISNNLKTFVCLLLVFGSKQAFSQRDTTKNTLENFDWLNEIVVSTNKDATKYKESVVGLSILKPYLIENKIILDASKVVNQIPGVVVNDGQINIRSGSGWSYGAGSRVMVTIDEMPMLSGDVGSVPFNFLPTEGIGGIEVIKNAGSVLYGSSALNGVVNMRTIPITKKQYINVNINGGFYDVPQNLKFTKNTLSNYGINGVYSEKIDNHSFAFTWNHLNDDGYRMAEHDYRTRVGWKYGYEFKSSSKLNPLKLWLNGSIQKGESGSFLIWQNDQKGYSTQDSSYSFNTGRRFNIDPVIEWNGKKWKHKFLNRYFTISNDIDNGDTNNNQDNKNALLYNEWKSKRSLNDKFDIIFGAVSCRTTSNSPLFNGTHNIQNLAGYFQTQYKSNGWIAQIGARYEHYNLDGNKQSKPVIRLGLNKQLSRATFLRASYGEGFRYPSMAELFTTTSTGAISVLPNGDLKPETGNNIEIGIKQGLKIKSKALGIISTYIDFAIFQNKYQNMMEYTFGIWKSNGPIPDFGFKSLNVGNATIRGFEFESAGSIDKNGMKIQWLLGYTYANPTVDNPNLPIAKYPSGEDITFSNTAVNNTNVSKYRNRHVFRSDIQFSKKSIEFGISNRYQSAFENVDSMFLSLIQGVKEVYRNGKNAGLITDIRVGYQLNESIKVQIQASNIFQTIYMARPADYNAPRLFQFQINYKFIGKDI
jgi:iron complex outermembrane receptor protein